MYENIELTYKQEENNKGNAVGPTTKSRNVVNVLTSSFTD